MIVADFLPRDDTLFAITDPVELTESVDDLALSYPNGWPDAYWYGWLRWENVPDSIKLSNVSCTGTGQDRTITATTIIEQNLNVGYVATGYDNTALYWYGMLKGLQPYTENAGKYQDSVSDVSPLFGSRFINKLDPRGVCPIHGGASAPAENAICLFVQLQRIYGDDRDGYNNFSVMSLSFDDTEDGINKFLKGDITKTISFSNYAVYDNGGYEAGRYSFSYELDINSSDFGAEHPNVWTYRFSQSGYDFILSVFMLGFGYPVGADNISSSTAYEYKTLRISPIISQIMDGTTYYGVGAQNYTNYIAFDSINNLLYESNLSGVSVSETLKSIDDYVYGGFNGSITLDNNGKNNYGIMFDNSANFSVCIERSGQDITKTRVLRIMSVEEMQHAATLNMRYVTKDSYLDASYGFGSGCYYPHISPENEYLCEWLTGEFDDIKDDLRPWQYGDIIDNEYNPGDLPPYTPGEDDSDDPKGPPNSGVGGDGFPETINVLPAQAFINYGAFPSAALTTLSAKLWNQPDNFFESLSASQKVNPMDYFISLRFYPFDLYDETNTLDTIYLGRGGVLQSASMTYTPYTRPSNVWSTQKLKVEPYYNSFLDYAPYTKIFINLPFCGQYELNSTLIMGKELKLNITVDFTEGSVVYIVNIIDKEEAYPILQKQGKIGADIPISGVNASQMGANIANATLTTAGHLIEAPGKILSGATNAVIGAETGNVANIASSIQTFGGLGLQALEDCHAMGMASKEIIDKIMPCSGYAAASEYVNSTPFIIYQRPICENPPSFGHTIGYLVNKKAKIKDVSGFTVCKNPDLSGISSATDKELKAIKDLLESGFYA